ncbi:hypothetical protein BRC94_03420 [Halobacteriales archaeon QS_5_70_17]|jgi:hypothetical protein|nr:MAG: hypothetical protein BRC94_03420 [Halobacteriales archaeon QS_5_70_17]
MGLDVFLAGDGSRLLLTLGTAVAVPVAVLVLGRLFDAYVRAWDPNDRPEDRLLDRERNEE